MMRVGMFIYTPYWFMLMVYFAISVVIYIIRCSLHIGVRFGVARFDISGQLSGRLEIVERAMIGLHVFCLYASLS